MAGSIHHAEDFYELAGRVYDSEEWEVRHRRLHGSHLPECYCFEEDEKRWRCESWMCELCKPTLHNTFLGCSECRVEWPCKAFSEARLAANRLRRPPQTVYPERARDDAA